MRHAELVGFSYGQTLGSGGDGGVRTETPGAAVLEPVIPDPEIS